MVLESNRELVLRRLLECLARDRTKHQVAEVTSLGLVQMTRKRVGSGLLESFSEPCECCNGRGLIVSLEPVEPSKPGRRASGRGGSARGGSKASSASTTADAEHPVPGQRPAEEGTGSSGGGSSGSGSSGAGSSGGGNSNSNTSSAGQSSAQILVISTDSWIVNASVDSTGVGKLANGDQAQIVPGSGAGTVYGTIASVGLIATSSSGVASYPVVINVTGSPDGMHAGDTATVSLIYHQLNNVLTVPTTAVHTVNGKTVVYEMVNGKRVSRSITTGLASGGMTEVQSGLSAGDEVVVDVVSRGTTTTNNRGNNQQRQFPSGGNFPGGGQFPGGGNNGQVVGNPGGGQ
jgi:hypothetical protein